MNKRDFIAIGLVIILSAVGFLLFAFRPKGGETVKISVNSSEKGSYPLSNNREIKIKTDSGYNTVAIKDGGVFIKDADCPDKYCVKQGKITSGSIICLPHRLVVEISGSESSPDAVAK